MLSRSSIRRFVNRRSLLQKRRLFWFGGCDVRELLHQLVELRDVIVDVLVAVLGIEISGELRRFVGGDFFWGGLNVVADLLARLVSATAPRGELVGSRAVAPAGADFRPILIE